MSVVGNMICPSDSGSQTCPTTDPNAGRSRGNYVGSVGPGDVYGNAANAVGSTNLTGPGMFWIVAGQNFDDTSNPPAQTRQGDVTDGTSKTIMFSEVLNTSLADSPVEHPRRPGGYLVDEHGGLAVF